MRGGAGMPDSVAINGAPCSVQGAALPPPAPPQTSHAESAASLTTVNGQIIGLDGQPLTLWGINWFGFETGTTMLDGLWAGARLLSVGFFRPCLVQPYIRAVRSVRGTRMLSCHNNIRAHALVNKLASSKSKRRHCKL